MNRGVLGVFYLLCWFIWLGYRWSLGSSIHWWVAVLLVRLIVFLPTSLVSICLWDRDDCSWVLRSHGWKERACFDIWSRLLLSYERGRIVFWGTLLLWLLWNYWWGSRRFLTICPNRIWFIWEFYLILLPSWVPKVWYWWEHLYWWLWWCWWGCS